MLILGYRTRVSTAIGWLVIGSIQSRNQLLLQHGDYLLRLLLFWSMFLPLGARFSLDARRRAALPENRFLSVAGGALLVQIACVYVFAGLFKLQPTWLDGEAVGESIDLYSSPDVVSTGELTLGERKLSAGPHRLSIVIQGANESAAKSYMFGLDYLRLIAD